MHQMTGQFIIHQHKSVDYTEFTPTTRIAQGGAIATSPGKDPETTDRNYYVGFLMA